jgi:hypothetical protein
MAYEWKKNYASCRWSHPDANGRPNDFNHLSQRPFGRPKRVAPAEDAIMSWGETDGKLRGGHAACRFGGGETFLADASSLARS